MKTSTTQTLPVRLSKKLPGIHRGYRHCRQAIKGLVLLELVVVFAIIAMLVGIVVMGPVLRTRRASIDRDVFQFVHTLRSTAEYAMFTGSECIVVIDIYGGYYSVYETADEEEYYDLSPLMEPGSLDICWIQQVGFEDGTNQYSGELIVHAGSQGWRKSLVFDLIDDRNELQRFVRCDHNTTNVLSSNQPLELLEPQEAVGL
jgi:type II secretory pathway pseudopilin PulG